MRGQHDIARRYRLNNGCCPEHGIPLTRAGVVSGKDIVGCTRGDCSFITTVKPGTKLAAALDAGKIRAVAL